MLVDPVVLEANQLRSRQFPAGVHCLSSEFCKAWADKLPGSIMAAWLTSSMLAHHVHTIPGPAQDGVMPSIVRIDDLLEAATCYLLPVCLLFLCSGCPR